MNKSRTAKSIKNSAVSMIFYFINLILQFYSRKIFLEYLGTEILGLNTTLTNILQFLNLAELGIGTAVGYSLYKPLEESKRDVINDIVSFQGKLYNKIGLFVICGGCVVMLAFPWIFAKSDLPLWYAYSTFCVLIFSASLGYFVNYKQILLSANQQGYLIQYSYKSAMLIKVVCQIICMKYLAYPYITWLSCEVLFAIIGSISLDIITKRKFPFLSKSRKSLSELRNRYVDLERKIKQIFVHQISGFVLTQTSPLIIYAYINLSEVTLYGNYNLIAIGIISLMTAVFNSLIPGIGNFMINATQDRTIQLFDQLFSIRFWFGSIVSFGVLNLTQYFISFWIGSEYLLSESSLIIITLILFVNIIRLGAGAFLSAMGMYSDIWAPMVEAVLNLGLSILFGFFWGLNGILIGVLISLILIPIVWKSYFLFHDGFKYRYSHFIKIFIKHTVVTGFVFYISMIILKMVTIPTDWIGFVIYSIKILSIFSILLTAAYCLFRFEFLNIIARLKKFK